MEKMDTTVVKAVTAVLGDSPYKKDNLDLVKFQVYLPKRFINFLMKTKISLDLDSVKPGIFYLV